MSGPSRYLVNYFGLLAERRGVSEEQVMSLAPTPKALYEELADQHRLGLVVGDFRVAVNDEFVDWNHPLQPGDRVALLPPMSGG